MKIQLTRSVQELLYSISERNTTFFRKFMVKLCVENLHILIAVFVNIVQILSRRLLAPAASRGYAEPSAPPRLLCAAQSAAHKKAHAGFARMGAPGGFAAGSKARRRRLRRVPRRSVPPKGGTLRSEGVPPQTA